MTREQKQGQWFTLIGLLLVCGTIVIRRSGIHAEDFLMGLMNGAGIGCFILALFRFGRKTKMNER